MSARRWVRSARADEPEEDEALSPGADSDDDGPGSSHPVLRPVGLTTWIATHDHGWVTVVCEQPDGTFAVLVAPPGARDVAPDALASSGPAARTTAEAILRTKSGHDLCTAQCEPWQQERHLLMLLAEDAHEFKGEAPARPTTKTRARSSRP